MTSLVAVTGAGGFVGMALLRSLRARGLPVRALCNRRSPLPPGRGDDVLWFHGAILDGDLLDDLLRGVETVVHLAGPPSVADSFRWPTDFTRIHVEGTVSLLEACARSGVARVVYLSSAEVYGAPRTERVREDHPCEPRSPYGAAKLSAEHFVRAAAHARAFEVTILRAFSIYGPGQSPACLLETVRRQATLGTCVRVNDPSPVRDFCHVDDVAAALVAAMISGAPQPRTYNVGSGSGISVGQVVSAALQAMGRSVPVLVRASGDRPASTVVARLVADPTRIAADLGWSPRIDLATGLRALFAGPSVLAWQT